MKNITIVGGGVLGSQIAYQTAYAGFNVTVYLRSEGSVERAKPKFERLHNIYTALLTAAKQGKRPVDRGLIFNAENPDDINYDNLIKKANDAYENINYCTDLAESVADADLVIEALSEDPKAKIEFYQNLSPVLPEKTILVTNSSTMLPSTFAEYTGRPEKYLALHFANNIWHGNTAEVMGHPGTNADYYNQVVEFAKQIGMIPLLLKKEQPGYLLNSLLVPFLNAAQALLVNDVSDPQTIDKTWMLATGAPMGPFRILDVIGIDTAYNIVCNYPDASDPTSMHGRVAKMLKEEYIDKGKTGINAGEGFYKYN